MDDTVRSEIMELNEEGKCTHYMDTSGYECWRDYDEDGNLVHLKNSKKCEVWFEYNENNVLIYSRHVDGATVVEYERSSITGGYNKTHWISSYGDEFWQKWDDVSRLMLSSCDTGDLDMYYKYDEDRTFTKIEEEEYNKIKKEGKEKEFLGREKISRFKLMEVENETANKRT